MSEVAGSEKSSRYAPAELQFRLDQCWRILNLNQELIRSADQKIYLLIAMSILLTTYVSSNIEKIMRIGILQTTILGLFFVCGITFFIFALSTLLPRQRVAAHSGEALPRLVFFGDITMRPDADIYIHDLRTMSIEQLLEDIPRQIYEVAQVAKSKYLSYRRAWQALLVEVVIFLILEVSIILAGR